MAFWSDTSIGVPEPKRNYRWLAYLGNIAEPWIAKTATKPGFTISEAEHSYINHKFYYPGRIEWNTVDITIVDPGSPDVAQSVWNALKASGYFPPESAADTSTISKHFSAAALGQVKIQHIGDGIPGTSDAVSVAGVSDMATEVLEEWILYNAWIKEAKFGDLDYTNDDLTEITLTLRYDYAKLNGDNFGGVVTDRMTTT